MVLPPVFVCTDAPSLYPMMLSKSNQITPVPDACYVLSCKIHRGLSMVVSALFESRRNSQ